MKDIDFSMGSARRVARQIIDMKDDKRKALLRTFPTDLKCKIVEEMVNMIETQRAYEVNSKAISAVDGMLRFINNNL